MKKTVLKPISIMTVFCMVGASYAMPSPDTEVSLEFVLSIVVSPNIINIESEIRWYGVELYNMEVGESQKVRGYKISTKELEKNLYLLQRFVW